jgi:GH15 family glucan-1,4-alpha-glucosidase
MAFKLRSMSRRDGYVPIRDYAVIGDGRTAALIAKDGSVDWLCLPDIDSGSAFGRILDAERGGFFELQPEEPFEVERRYEPDSNVLETTFRTSSGAVRLTDALALAGEHLGPMRELVRRVEGLSGTVPMRWRIEPRFDFGRRRATIGHRSGRPFAWAGQDGFVMGAWDAGDPQLSDNVIEGRFEAEPGRVALLDLAATHQQPAVIPGRGDAERRLEQTQRFWPEWTRRLQYDGRWRDDVARSALVLKLCVFSPSGAIIAAPTTSLPEWIGSGRNWDYRFTWLRDASFTLDALLRLGYEDEAHAFFWWYMHASRLTEPRLQVLYRVDGSTDVREDVFSELAGYCDSSPVRIGNGAVEQFQLDLYGDVLDSIWVYHCNGHKIDRRSAKDVAKVADYVCKIWRRHDCGIWEEREGATDFIHSKAMCWVALDRACKLAAAGVIPDRSERWRSSADEIRAFVDEHGWDEERRTYVRARDDSRLDGSLLTLPLFEFHDADDPRLLGTIDAIKRELASGPLVYRYRDGDEGAFVACSFWLADALIHAGRLDEAEELMTELCKLANDVGLFAEEVRESDGAFLGNFPQALVHLALANAAISYGEAMEGRI